jgi:hypothetical protein
MNAAEKSLWGTTSIFLNVRKQQIRYRTYRRATPPPEPCPTTPEPVTIPEPVTTPEPVMIAGEGLGDRIMRSLYERRPGESGSSFRKRIWRLRHPLRSRQYDARRSDRYRALEDQQRAEKTQVLLGINREVVREVHDEALLRAYAAGLEDGRAGRNCPMTLDELHDRIRGSLP